MIDHTASSLPPRRELAQSLAGAAFELIQNRAPVAEQAPPQPHIRQKYSIAEEKGGRTRRCVRVHVVRACAWALRLGGEAVEIRPGLGSCYYLRLW